MTFLVSYPIIFRPKALEQISYPAFLASTVSNAVELRTVRHDGR